MTGLDVWVLEAGGEARAFLTSPFDEQLAMFSPDGQWIAYVSNRSGQNDVYVRPYPGPVARIQLSSGGSRDPVWNPNGEELFYLAGTKMMAVPVVLGSTLQLGQPRELFDVPAVAPEDSAGLGLAYDVTPDGEQFVMVDVGASAPAPSQLNVVLNWVEELKARVPTEQ